MSHDNGMLPLLVGRVAGFPFDVVEAFSTDLGTVLAKRWELERLLREARGNLAKRLYEAIPRTERNRRRILLAVKRDCHNGRLLGKSRDDWRIVVDAAGPEAHRLLELEPRYHAAVRQFEVAYAQERRGQVRRAAELMDDPLFRCGLAVASPQLAGGARRLRNEAAKRHGRRDMRLAAALLRYASRAALKLSPFSTFTQVGLVQVNEGDAPPALAPAWSPRSLVRLRRHLLDRCLDLLRDYPPLRRRLVVELNDSVFCLRDGRVLFQRPSYYRAGGAGTLTYHDEALVKVRLRGPVVNAVVEILADRAVPYDELTARLAHALEERVSWDGVVRQLDQLIDIGYLHLQYPWSVDDEHLEKSMLRELRRMAVSPGIEDLLSELQQLVQLEEGLLQAADPEGAIHRMRELTASLLQNAADLAGSSAIVGVGLSLDREIYQDVWCVPQGDNEAVVSVGRQPLDVAVRSVTPLVRLARLHDHRLDFLCTLGAVLRKREGGRHLIPFMEVLDSTQPLWKDFVRFQVSSQSGESKRPRTWNPLGLSQLSELARWREQVEHSLSSCVHDTPEGRRLSITELECLLTPIPARYTEPNSGACLFLQPASKDGSLWMLNRLKEGTGRFASRYTAVMHEGLRHLYAGTVASRSTLQLDGERAELLDVQCVHGDTLNVHVAHTPKVLLLPGAVIELPRERQRRLSDLMVSLTNESWPCLRDRGGTRYLPVHLGVGYSDYMPAVLRFLCAFGPSELGAIFPPPLTRTVNGTQVHERMIIGNVLLHRRTWTARAGDLRHLFHGRGEAGGFAALQRWHRDRGLPEKVFVIERTLHHIAGVRYKAQYVDLTSPLFVNILRHIVDSAGETVSFVEMLPSAEVFPRDAQGRKWPIELLVESLML